MLTIGVEGNPVKAGVSAEIVIHRDNGAINVSEDPKQLSKGVVMHGVVRMAGQDKDDFLRAEDDPQKGDTTLAFSERPAWAGRSATSSSWRAPSWSARTSSRTRSSPSRASTSELRGDDRPAAQNDHTAPDDFAGVDFQVPVANYTRNIRIGTETPRQRLSRRRQDRADRRARPCDVHGQWRRLGAERRVLRVGRTDKSVLLDNEGGTNLGGRYALHFHRTGGEVGDTPALAEGNAVWGSPGWGIVHHDFNLDVI